MSDDPRAFAEPVFHGVVPVFARASEWLSVKRNLQQYGYQPDRQEAATNSVLHQAELLSGSWTDQKGASS